MTYDPILEKAKRFYNKKLDGMKKSWRLAFDRIKARAERAEAAQGLGKCVDCHFYVGETGHWGYCNFMKAADSYPTWPRPWIHLTQALGRYPTWKMAVSKDFGCVLHAKKESLSNIC